MITSKRKPEPIWPAIPTSHPLWPQFTAWVKLGKLHPGMLTNRRQFWLDGNLMWRTFLAGVRAGESKERRYQRRGRRE